MSHSGGSSARKIDREVIRHDAGGVHGGVQGIGGAGGDVGNGGGTKGSGGQGYVGDLNARHVCVTCLVTVGAWRDEMNNSKFRCNRDRVSLFGGAESAGLIQDRVHVYGHRCAGGRCAVCLIERGGHA